VTTTAPGPLTASAQADDICVVDLSACGDAAVRITVRGPDDEAVWHRVHALARFLNAGGVAGIHSAVPTYDAILVEFDPHRSRPDEVRRGIHEADAALAGSGAHDGARPSRLIRVPTLFGGALGTDLEWIAGVMGLPPGEVVERFCAEDRTVRCLGGPAASAMMDGPALGRPVPRLSNPRLQVPAGAVSLAGRQAVLGPVAAPSGWRQIGCTSLRILDVDAAELVPYAPGDRLRFVPVTRDEYDGMAGRTLGARDA
jgi:KipI family sensor histidine kinase inhibitor